MLEQSCLDGLADVQVVIAGHSQPKERLSILQSQDGGRMGQLGSETKGRGVSREDDPVRPKGEPLGSEGSYDFVRHEKPALPPEQSQIEPAGQVLGPQISKRQPGCRVVRWMSLKCAKRTGMSAGVG